MRLAEGSLLRPGFARADAEPITCNRFSALR